MYSYNQRKIHKLALNTTQHNWHSNIHCNNLAAQTKAEYNTSDVATGGTQVTNPQ